MSILKEISPVASVAMPIGEMWTVNRCRYRSEDGSAGRLCIATGIHGDELEGQYVCYEVERRIAAHPEYLTGVVDIYPALNPLGIDSITRGRRRKPCCTS